MLTERRRPEMRSLWGSRSRMLRDSSSIAMPSTYGKRRLRSALRPFTERVGRRPKPWKMSKKPPISALRSTLRRRQNRMSRVGGYGELLRPYHVNHY